MQMPSGSWHSNSYASASEKTRPRVRRARTEEGSRCLLSQDPVSLFRFFSLFLPFCLASPPTAQDETLFCFVPCIHRAHSFSLLRARMRMRVRAYAHAKLRASSREQGGEEERAGKRERNPAATRGPSRWRRINRCALHLAPPRSPATPSSHILGCHPSATDSDLRTRARISPCTSRTAYDLRATQTIYIRERYSSVEEPKIDRRNERKLSRGYDAFFIRVIRLT